MKNMSLIDKLYIIFYIGQSILWIAAFLYAMVTILIIILLGVAPEQDFNIYLNIIGNCTLNFIIVCLGKIVLSLIYKVIGLFLNVDLKSIKIFKL
jgi:hypothetical protein